ncbi:MAG: hypothetical protein QNJ40_21625 [Xanthomonadales bacterium]|nr:hypothetical protein [Xanthomonadales bacterium]
MVDSQEGPATHSNIPRVFVEKPADDEILSRLKEIASEAPTGLIADSDSWLRWIGQHRSILENSFSVVIHPTNDTLDKCLNKTGFLRWCAANDVRSPKIYEPSELDGLDLSQRPVIVRPEVTQHGRAVDIPKAEEISDRSALEDLLQSYDALGLTPTITESLLRPDTRQYSVGVARNSRGEVRALVAEKLRPSARQCSTGTYVVASPDPEVAAQCIRIAHELDLLGIAEIEMLQIDKRYLYAIEVNPRPWAQYALAWKSGFDFLTFVLDPDAYRQGEERRSGGRWLSFWEDLYAVWSRSEGMLKGGEISIAAYVRSVLGSNVFPYWSISDLGPWVHQLQSRH